MNHGGELFITLLGAVALMLWGIRMVRTGMTRAFGAWLRKAVGHAGKNRLTAFAAGMGVTVVLQSATATALLLVSFAGRSLVALPVALAIMLGADVGSTLVARLFAIDIKGLWAVGLFAGVLLFNMATSERTKNAGRIAIGLGLMLLALSVINGISSEMRSSTAVASAVHALGAQPFVALLLSILLTWFAHSSLAIILFIMSLASSGAVGPTLAPMLILGANLGGAMIPLAPTAGSSAKARRVPLGNLLARLTTALGVLVFYEVSPSLIASFGSTAASQVLNFHIAFNVLTAALFLPLVCPLADLTVRLLPEAEVAPELMLPQHLDPAALAIPSEALACATREALHVGDIVLDMLNRSLGVIANPNSRRIKELEKSDDRVDRLHEAIKHYLVRASKFEMSEAEGRRYVEILTFNTNLEHIGDIVDKNLMELAGKMLKKGVSFSAEGHAELQRFHEQVVENMRLAMSVFATRNVALARSLLQIKTGLRAQEVEAADRHYARLRDGRSESIETSSVHLDVIRDFKRINSHLTSVAYPILEEAGELRQSRLVEQRLEAEPLSTTLVTGSSR